MAEEAGLSELTLFTIIHFPASCMYICGYHTQAALSCDVLECTSVSMSLSVSLSSRTCIAVRRTIYLSVIFTLECSLEMGP